MLTEEQIHALQEMIAHVVHDNYDGSVLVTQQGDVLEFKIFGEGGDLESHWEASPMSDEKDCPYSFKNLQSPSKQVPCFLVPRSIVGLMTL